MAHSRNKADDAPFLKLNHFHTLHSAVAWLQMLRNPSTTSDQRTAMLHQLRDQGLSQPQQGALAPHLPQPTQLISIQNVAEQQPEQHMFEILPLYIAPKPPVSEDWDAMVHPELTSLLRTLLGGAKGIQQGPGNAAASASARGTAFVPGMGSAAATAAAVTATAAGALSGGAASANPSPKPLSFLESFHQKQQQLSALGGGNMGGATSAQLQQQQAGAKGGLLWHPAAAAIVAAATAANMQQQQQQQQQGVRKRPNSAVENQQGIQRRALGKKTSPTALEANPMAAFGGFGGFPGLLGAGSDFGTSNLLTAMGGAAGGAGKGGRGGGGGVTPKLGGKAGKAKTKSRSGLSYNSGHAGSGAFNHHIIAAAATGDGGLFLSEGGLETAPTFRDMPDAAPPALSNSLPTSMATQPASAPLPLDVAMASLAQALHRSCGHRPLGVINNPGMGLQQQQHGGHQLQNQLGLLMGLKQHLQQAGGPGKAVTTTSGAQLHHAGDKRAGVTTAARADMSVRLGDGENVRPASGGGDVHSRDQHEGPSISYQQLLLGGDAEVGAEAAAMVGADGGKSFHWKKSKLI